MDKNKAIKYVIENARPLELAVYRYFFEDGRTGMLLTSFQGFRMQTAASGMRLSRISSIRIQVLSRRMMQSLPFPV